MEQEYQEYATAPRVQDLSFAQIYKWLSATNIPTAADYKKPNEPKIRQLVKYLILSHCWTLQKDKSAAKDIPSKIHPKLTKERVRNPILSWKKKYEQDQINEENDRNIHLQSQICCPETAPHQRIISWHHLYHVNRLSPFSWIAHQWTCLDEEAGRLIAIPILVSALVNRSWVPRLQKSSQITNLHTQKQIYWRDGWGELCKSIWNDHKQLLNKTLIGVASMRGLRCITALDSEQQKVKESRLHLEDIDCLHTIVEVSCLIQRHRLKHATKF